MSMKNFKDTIGNRTHEFPACSALLHINRGGCYVIPPYDSQVHKPAPGLLSASGLPFMKQMPCGNGPIKIFLISTFYDTVGLSLLYRQKCLTKYATKDILFCIHPLYRQFYLNKIEKLFSYCKVNIHLYPCKEIKFNTL
jgi:hypothetical protein